MYLPHCFHELYASKHDFIVHGIKAVLSSVYTVSCGCRSVFTVHCISVLYYCVLPSVLTFDWTVRSFPVLNKINCFLLF